MINAISQRMTKFIENYLPDAFVFALFLTFITLLGGWLGTPASFDQVMVYWGDGFFSLLAFSMQMVLILILGMTLAQTRMMTRLIGGIAMLAKTERHAFVLVALFSSLFCWLNWGLGLVLGGLIAKRMVEKFPHIRFGTLLGLSYGGFMVWHGGLSGSIPLKMSSGGNVMNTLNLKPVEVSETIFSSYNLTLTALVILFLVCLAFLIPVRGKHKYHIKEQDIDDAQVSDQNLTPSLKWEQSFWIILVAVILIFYYVGSVLFTRGLTLDLVNIILFGLALFYHGSARNFMNSFSSSMKNATGIIIAFPFYAGIMSVIASSGLGEDLTQNILSLATEKTFYVFTYLSAGLVNFFVPSGGGQWVVQGPITLAAASKLGLSIPKAALALSWGDAWTNMIQPFWAIPLLSLAGLRLKDIMPICFFLFISVGAITSLYFYFAS